MDDSDSEIKENLADIVKKEKLATRVDVTADVEDKRIVPSKLGESSNWSAMEERLRRDLDEADDFLAMANKAEDTAKADFERYLLLKKQTILPSTDRDKKLITLNKEKIVRDVRKLAQQRKRAYSSYNFCKKQLNDHMKMKKKESKNEDGKIVKINGRFFQWWEGLPSYLRKYQPEKECAKDLYRRIREVLIIDPTLLEHKTMVQLMDRYR